MLKNKKIFSKIDSGLAATDSGRLKISPRQKRPEVVLPHKLAKLAKSDTDEDENFKSTNDISFGDLVSKIQANLLSADTPFQNAFKKVVLPQVKHLPNPSDT